jgi:phosphatidate cytidylyltransferase
MDDVTGRVAIVSLVLFAAGAAFIVVAERVSGRRARRIWLSYWVQFAIVGAVLIPLALGPAWFSAAMALVALQATREMIGVLRAGGLAPCAPLAHVAVVVLLGAAWRGGGAALAAVTPVAAAALWLAAAGWTGRRADAGATVLVLAVPGVGLASCVALVQAPSGPGALAFLYLVVEFGDCCALLIGKYFGRRAMWPRLSPGKTAAGSAAGLAGAVGMAAACSFVIPGRGLFLSAAAGALLGVAGQAADLAASAIKRWAGVKDYGALVPTHGGVLDVYDSFALTAPLWLVVVSLT